MTKVLRAGLCIVALACTGAPLSAQAPASNADIPISGHISTDMANRVHAALKDGKPHTVRVNSSGGEDTPALAIAADMARTHSTLVAEGICAGPCANYLFMAASRRTVQPGALVIFTASASSRMAMVPQARRKEVSSLYENTARQERQLLQDRHASAALLLEPQLGLGTACYSLTSRDTAGKAYINYQAQFVGWTPSRAWLARAGADVAGFWPDTDAQFQAAMQKAIPGGARGGVTYSTAKTPAQEAALLKRLAAIPECDTGLPKKK